VGVIGLGYWGPNLLRVLADDPDVEVKWLCDRDPERLARFAREAEMLAALNHQNIASVYGVEETADARALVMELVEGETLADRIGRGALPVDEAIAIAEQIAGERP
jgi:serine/threonine protein kinase